MVNIIDVSILVITVGVCGMLLAGSSISTQYGSVTKGANKAGNPPIHDDKSQSSPDDSEINSNDTV